MGSICMQSRWFKEEECFSYIWQINLSTRNPLCEVYIQVLDLDITVSADGLAPNVVFEIQPK